MSGVLLTRLWVHDASDLSNNLDILVLDEAETTEADIDVRRYAGGRDRAVGGPGTRRTLPLQLRSVSRTNYYTLIGLIEQGSLVMVRLPRGRKMWGIFASTQAVEHRRVDRIDNMPLTFQEVSHDEAV